MGVTMYVTTRNSYNTNVATAVQRPMKPVIAPLYIQRIRDTRRTRRRLLPTVTDCHRLLPTVTGEVIYGHRSTGLRRLLPTVTDCHDCHDCYRRIHARTLKPVIAPAKE